MFPFNFFGTPEGVTRITPQVGQTMLNDEKDIVLIDVRTSSEYNNGHIRGAKLVPLDTINNSKIIKKILTNTKIIVYCQSGVRSAQAAKKLSGLGYTQIYDMGGITNWPYEIVR